MRELEFLPEWYPQIRRKRRSLVFHGWLTLMVVIAVGLWMLLAQQNVRAKQSSLVEIKSQLSETQTELDKLKDLLTLQRQLGHQDQIIVKLGKHIEASRLMAALDELMPPNVALISLTAENEEQMPAPGSLAALRAQQDHDKGPAAKKLRVKVQALAPTDEDLANFLSKLTAKPFEQVALNYSKQRTESGHVMREFEVAFDVDLSAAGGE
jgi:hypothetical protein